MRKQSAAGTLEVRGRGFGRAPDASKGSLRQLRRRDKRRGHGPERGQIHLFQSQVPDYRIRLFDALANELDGRFLVLTDARRSTDDAALRLPLSAARTWTFGPIRFMPRALASSIRRDNSTLILPWNIRHVELIPVLLLARAFGNRVVLWGHGIALNSGRFTRIMRRLQGHLAHVVITYSESGARRVRALGVRAPVSVVVNTTGHNAPSVHDHLARVNHAVAYVGRVQERKHVPRLIEALAILRESGLEVRAEIVGSGSALSLVRSLAERRGVDDLCTWRGPIAVWPELRHVLSQVDMVVLPAHAGLAVVDAFAAARCAIVPADPSSSPPEAESVVDGDTGFRYAPSTAAGLATCIRRAYESPDALRRTSARAAAVYRETMTLDAAVSAFVSALESLSSPGHEDARVR